MDDQITMKRNRDGWQFGNPYLTLAFARAGDGLGHGVTPTSGGADRGFWSLVEPTAPDVVTIPPLQRLEHSASDHGVDIRGEARVGPHRLTVQFHVPSAAAFVRVSVEDDLTEAIEVERVESRYRLAAARPNFTFTPTIRPRDDYVIGEPSFKVPAVIVQQDDVVLGLIADMDGMARRRNPLRYCLDMEADPGIVPSPVVAFGLKDHEPDGLLYYRHSQEMRRRVGPGRLEFGYYLFVLGGQRDARGFRSVVRFLWQNFGHRAWSDAVALPAPIESYARQGIDYALKHLWVDIPVDGDTLGGVMSGIRYPNDIWFHSLFNNLNGAYALQHFGDACRRPDWSRRAAIIRNLILSAPADRGVFPTIAHSQVRYARRETRWIPSSHWMLTDGMGEACVTFQRHNVSKVIDWEHLYSTTQCSYTANLLLRGHREVEADPRAVRFCTEYGDFLVAHQEQNGAIPTFFEVGTLCPDQVLPRGAETACSAMFLAHLYIVTRDERFLRAARNAEAFVAENVIRSNKWQDHETYFDSCGKPIDFWDSHTGQYAQSTQCMSWAAEMYRLLAEATGAEAYLDSGCAVLDYLALFQQTWQAPFRSVPTIGGFAVGNGHAAWNDARQGLFSPIFVKYSEATGHEEYLLRGLAAARAGLWLMFVPENARIAPHMFDKGPTGHADENYAHRGEDRPALVGYCFDYQVGGTLAALGYLQRTHGDVRVSVKRQTAYAINAVDVGDIGMRDDTLSLRVRRRSSATTRVRITVGEPARSAYRMVVNDRDLGILSAAELERGVEYTWTDDAELGTPESTGRTQ